MMVGLALAEESGAMYLVEVEKWASAL